MSFLKERAEEHHYLVDGAVLTCSKCMDETVTTEAILFCKHGGFIYPKTSGYIKTDIVQKEENGLKDQKEDVIVLLKKAEIGNADIAIFVWEFFRDKGFSEYVVAGILGNVYQETGGSFDSEVINNNG